MKSYIPTLLEEIFGDIRSHAEHKGQIAFDCPMCDNGDHKGNLEINYEMGVYKCWSCRDINRMSGHLSNLISKYGNSDLLETYNIFKPREGFSDMGRKDTREFECPKSMVEISTCNSEPSNRVKDYLYDRGLTDKHFKKYKLMYSLTKGYKGRVIIPSFDANNEISYFVSRSIYDFLKPKYKNPNYDKDNIIMFENLIDWDSDVYLVEGVFDSMVLPNSIPILGKYASFKLIKALRDKAKANIIICLDGDAHTDMENLYHDLNILELRDRIRVIYLSDDWDLSEIYKKYGNKGIVQTLKQATKVRF